MHASFKLCLDFGKPIGPDFSHGFPAVFLDVNFSPRKKKQILMQIPFIAPL